MRPGLMGRKLGMSQLFDDDKHIIPVTVIQADPNVILQVKTADNDGYDAVKLGFDDVKPQRARRADAGQSKAAEAGPKRFFGEVRLDEAAGEDLAVGKTLTVEQFEAGQKVDVCGTSKGRGFAGVMKRHGFKGAIATHGTHEFFRHGGAIGMATTPAHVIKGMKMPGQMGNKRATTQNLTVVRVDAEQNLLFIKGSVPGARKSLVWVRGAVKTRKKR